MLRYYAAVCLEFATSALAVILQSDNKHIGYSYPGERSYQFWFILAFELRAIDSAGTRNGQTIRQTDGQDT